MSDTERNVNQEWHDWQEQKRQEEANRRMDELVERVANAVVAKLLALGLVAVPTQPDEKH